MQALIGKVAFLEVGEALLGLQPIARGGFGAVYRFQNFPCSHTEDGRLRCSCFEGEVAVKVITGGTEKEHDFRQELIANAGIYGLWSCRRARYYTCGHPSAALAAQLGLLDSDDPVYIQIMPFAKHGSLRDLLSGTSRDNSGTPWYQPRIVEQRGAPDPTVDLFSWGVVLAELLCHQHGVVIQGGDFRSAFLRVLDGPPPTSPDAPPFVLTLAAASIVALATWELPEEDWDCQQAPSLRPRFEDVVNLMYSYKELVNIWQSCSHKDPTGASLTREGLETALRLFTSLLEQSKLELNPRGATLPATEQTLQKVVEVMDLPVRSGRTASADGLHASVQDAFIVDVFSRHITLKDKDLLLNRVQYEFLAMRFEKLLAASQADQEEGSSHGACLMAHLHSEEIAADSGAVPVPCPGKRQKPERADTHILNKASTAAACVAGRGGVAPALLAEFGASVEELQAEVGAKLEELHVEFRAKLQVPAVDDCHYRLITLDNGLKALLVHDEAADKAAAACDFCEHMLFYSSEKYPEEDEYSKFISEHGGHTNAYTSNESTNYHFDCNWEHLPEALDRFAQFFISPLISADGVDREANAVDSEHGKNLNSDPWRKLQLWRSTAAPGHPFSRFSTGNLDTLINLPKSEGINVHERVRQFHQQHYSAGVSKLVVVGRHTLDELEGMVREQFSAVKDTGISPPSFTPDAVTEGQCGTLLRLVPQRDTHTIELQWPTLPESRHYAEAPSHYVSHLLGHEGEGSVFAYLKAKGWASGLVAGEAGTSYSARSFFMVRIDLTEEGQKHAHEAVAAVFRYLDLLRAEDGINEKVWGELRALSEMKFQFRDKQPPYSYASSLAHCMQVYRDEDLLTGMYGVPLRYDSALIRQVVQDLTPERARVMWASKTLEAECDQQEKWYATQYSLGPIPEEWLALWREGGAEHAEALHLPRANPFIPTQFDMIQADVTPAPSVIHDSGLVRLWHRPDPSFKVPKAALYCHFQLVESYLTPEAAVLTQLYTKLLNDYLSEVTYPAELAGLTYGIRSTTSGLFMSCYGYHHTLPALAQARPCGAAAVAPQLGGHTVLDEVVSFQVRPDRFEVVQEKLARDFANMKYDQPYQYAMYTLGVLCEAKRWHISDYEQVLPGVTPEQLQAFLPRLLSRCRVDVLAAGNITSESAAAFAKGLEEQLSQRCKSRPPLPSQAPEARVVRLRPGAPALLSLPGPNPANDNSAVVVAFQLAQDELRCNALAELATHIGKRDAFHQLRTVEQLGFEREQQEVDQLRALTKNDLVAFYRECVLSPITRRKLSVRVEGHRSEPAEAQHPQRAPAEAAAAGTAAAAAEGATPTAVNASAAGGQQGHDASIGTSAGKVGGDGGLEGQPAVEGQPAGALPAVEVIGDVYAFKRRQELFPSLR
ncbi:hypothetical protein N2152v2_005148 [Parachlorella kessleri]